MKWKVRRHRGGSGYKRVGSEEASPQKHLAAHLCATQWLGVGRPPWGGWPLEALWRAAGAMFVGFNFALLAGIQLYLN